MIDEIQAEPDGQDRIAELLVGQQRIEAQLRDLTRICEGHARLESSDLTFAHDASLQEDRLWGCRTSLSGESLATKASGGHRANMGRASGGHPRSFGEMGAPRAMRASNCPTARAMRASLGGEEAAAEASDSAPRPSTQSQMTTASSTLGTCLAANWPKCIEIRSQFELREGRPASCEDMIRNMEGKLKRNRRARSRVSAHQHAITDSNKLGTSSEFVDRRARKTRPVCQVAPTSPGRLAFDLISLIVLAGELVMLPYTLAWDTPFWIEGACVSICVWTFDIALNFRTGYYVKGSLVMDGQAIARHYIRTLFTLDLVLVLIDIINLVLNSVSGDTGSTGVSQVARIAKVSRVVRILVLLRMVRFGEVFERLGDAYPLLRNSAIVVDVLKVLFLMLWLNHVLCCAWYALGRSVDSDTGYRWLALPISDDPFAIMYEEAGFWYQYWTSFHWTLTQMVPGSMQVVPMNSAERIMNIACLLFGLGFFSSLVSHITAKTTHIRMQMHSRITAVSTLSRFLRSNAISQHLIIRVERQVKERLNQRRPLTLLDVPCCKLLSRFNREELQWELCMPHLFRHPFLRICGEIEERTTFRIANDACDFVALPTSDVLFQGGQTASSAYVLMRGAVVYIPDHLSSSGYTEEIVLPGQWMSEAAIWCNWQHVGTTTNTKAASEIMVLNGDQFANVVQESHIFNDFAVPYASLFCSRLSCAGPPETDWPTDLVIPQTSYAEILASAPHEMQTALGLAVLEIHKATSSAWTSWVAGLHAVSLEQDLLQETSFLAVTEIGQVETVSVRAQLRLESDSGRIFVHLGSRRNNGEHEIWCDMPGVHICKDDKSCKDAFQRLLRRADLVHFAEALEVEAVGTVRKSDFSQRTRIFNTHIDYISTATLVDTFEMPQFAVATVREPPEEAMGHNQSAVRNMRTMSMNSSHSDARSPSRAGEDWAQKRDVFTFPDGDAVLFNAWLSVGELQSLQSPFGNQIVSDWLTMLDINNDVTAEILPPGVRSATGAPGGISVRLR